MKTDNLVTLLTTMTQHFGPRIALRTHGAIAAGSRSYQSLDTESAVLADLLVTSGLAQGDRAALLCEPGPDWVLALFAIWRVGAVAVLVETGLDTAQLEKLLGSTRPRVLLAAPEAMASASASLSSVDASTVLLDLGRIAAMLAMPAIHASKANGHRQTVNNLEHAPELLTCVIDEHGSVHETVCRFGELAVQTHLLRRASDYGGQDCLFALPLNQASTIVRELLGVLSRGGCVRFCASLRPIDVLAALRDERTLNVHCAGGASKLLVQAMRNEAAHWSPVRRGLYRLAMSAVPGSRVGLCRRVFRTLRHSQRRTSRTQTAFTGVGECLRSLCTRPASLCRMLLVSLACLLAAPASAARIAYLAEQDMAYVSELYLADLDRPRESTKLNKALTRFSNGVIAFAISPDGSKIAFSADQEIAGDTDLFVVDIANPGSWTRIGDLPAGSQELRMHFSPDGRQLAFTASDSSFGNVQLYLADLAQPGVAIRMNGALIANGSVSMTGFGFTSDGQHIVYAANELDSKFELYAVAVGSPGRSVRLNAPGGSVGDSYEGRFRILPDSRRIVYSAVWQNPGRRELHVVSLDAPGQPVTLNPSFASGGTIQQFDVSPDGSHVVYLADPVQHGIFEVFLVTTHAPGIAQKVNGPVLNGAGLAQFIGNGNLAAFVADGARGRDERDLFTVPVDGHSEAIRLNAPVSAGEDVSRFAVSSDGKQIAYPVVGTNGFARDLYVVQVDAPDTALQINGPLPGGALEIFPQPQFSPDGTEVAFIAVESVDTSIQQLYFSPLSAPGTSIRINPGLAPGGIVSPQPHAFEFLPAGAPPTGSTPGRSTPTEAQGASSGGGVFGMPLLLVLLITALRLARCEQAIERLTLRTGSSQ